MQCPQCQHDNREGAKFCEECGNKFVFTCPNCKHEVRPQAKFCDECGTLLTVSIPPQQSHQKPAATQERNPASYTPQYLAEKILTNRNALQGERKQVTVMFADIKDSTELIHERLGQTGIPAAVSRSVLAWCAAELGAFAEGIEVGEEGVRIAETAGQPFSLALAYLGAGFLYLRKGDVPKAIPILERGLGLCQASNIAAVLPRTASALGATYALCERIGDALPLLEQVVEQESSMRFMVDYVLLLAWLSQGYLLTGRLEDATVLASRALDLSLAHKERGHEALSLRLLGNVAMYHDPPDVEQAEIHYRQALALANELGMRPLQAHCHRGLGTLYHQIGQLEQARVELSASIEMYRDMEMTFWLPETEAALANVEKR